jgi:hypothetical protein
MKGELRLTGRKKTLHNLLLREPMFHPPDLIVAEDVPPLIQSLLDVSGCLQ